MNSIDKALNPDPKRKPEKVIKFASDIDKIKFDVEADIVDQLKEAFENEKKPGQSFSDWLNSKDKDYLIRLNSKKVATQISHSNLEQLKNINKRT